MKVCYGDLWFWLRKPSEERLSVFEAAECEKMAGHRTRRRLSTKLLGRHILSLAAKCGKSEDFIRHISERVVHKNPEALMRLLDTPLGMGFNVLRQNMTVFSMVFSHNLFFPNLSAVAVSIQSSKRERHV